MKKRKIALGELFKVGSSKRVLKSQWKTEGVPFYRGREITRLSADGFVDNELFISESDFANYATKHGVPTSGDIVITAIGTIGNSYIVKKGDRFYFKDASVLWLKKEMEVSSEFINLWLKSPMFFDQLDKGNGATVDTLTIKKLQSALVDLPPLPEQKRIVAILDEAFAGIDAAVANTEKNLANARELFESYLNGVFTRKGDGWVEETLGDCLQLITYGFTNPMPTTATGPYMVTAKNVVGGQINYSSARCTSQEAFSDLLTDKSRPLVGDVLLTKDGTLGRLAVVDRLGICINQSVALLRPNERMEPHFMRYLLSSPYYQQRMRDDAGGTTIKHIYITRVDKMAVGFPESLREQQCILEKLDSMSKETQRLKTIYQQKLTALTELKQSILQKAFAGEL